MKTLLITGASGTLGRQVARQALQAGWEVVGTYRYAAVDLPIRWTQLALEDPAAIRRLVEQEQPDAIVNTAFRQGGAGMWEVTAEGAAHIAVAAARRGARLVHLSTDALFDGTASPYDEAARPNPLHVYGAAKAAAETAIAAVAPNAAIVRTSLIISREPPDPHSRLALDIAAGVRPGRLFTDEYRCPVAVEDLAAAVLELCGMDFGGVINVAGPDAVSRHELGMLVLRAHGRHEDLPSATLAGSGLQRPPDLRLDLTRARALLITRLRGVHAYLGGPPTA